VVASGSLEGGIVTIETSGRVSSTTSSSDDNFSSDGKEDGVVIVVVVGLDGERSKSGVDDEFALRDIVYKSARMKTIRYIPQDHHYRCATIC